MKAQRTLWILLITFGLYILFASYNQPLDYSNCHLCDGNEYLKLYWYFEKGETTQIAFPFYTRPLVPFLASLVPGSNPSLAFHFINALFILLSVPALLRLWQHMKLNPLMIWVGTGWLLLQWTGLIRYNLYDFVTVDVPIYFFQALALWLFFRNRFKWFYVLTPLALLQKESFLAVLLVFIFIQLLFEKRPFFTQSKHLFFALIIGVSIQKLVLLLMPEQHDQRSSLMAILWHGKWALEDPSRFVRWFAAFGSAFGVLPFIILTKLNRKLVTDKTTLTLLTLTTMYCAFGLLAGEDMTRILFLGFPFIITFSLYYLQNEPKWMVGLVLVLSFVTLRLEQLPVNADWSVDYAEMSYVYNWALYYAVTALLFIAIIHIKKNRKSTT